MFDVINLDSLSDYGAGLGDRLLCICNATYP